MNKYQEALDDIKYNTRYRYVTFKISSLETLQELVDKETPMKVKHNVDGIWHKYKCGSCDNELDWKFLYCPYCGQELDWSEE